MPANVVRIVRELREDHRNMSLLLDLIEREADRLFDGRDADYELLHDIMRYMTVYPDAVHHPKEDRLYGEMRDVRPDLTSGFQRISLDHRKISEMGVQIRNDLASIEAGSMISRKSVVAEALRYVNALRSHMQWEELDLFKRCLAMAEEGHEFLEAGESGLAGDPLFGPATEAQFAGLLRRIRELAADTGDDVAGDTRRAHR
ncbi:MAG: hemerythrin domain-containing protein [Woeseiaceae bacterium]|nr:hemerythrin domain-containing protein [Woeseiaceae bacterium]